jgi:hypothetical protein
MSDTSSSPGRLSLRLLLLFVACVASAVAAAASLPLLLLLLLAVAASAARVAAARVAGDLGRGAVPTMSDTLSVSCSSRSGGRGPV